MSLMFLHASKKEQGLDYGPPTGRVFLLNCIFRCIHRTLPVYLTHTLIQNTASESECPPPPHTSAASVIKTLAHCPLYNFSFWVSMRRRPSLPSALLHHYQHRPNAAFVCHLARCWGVGQWGGGCFTHCWALGHGNPTACKTPRLCSVCACVCDCVWVFGCKQKATV